VAKTITNRLSNRREGNKDISEEIIDQHMQRLVTMGYDDIELEDRRIMHKYFIRSGKPVLTIEG